jgi:hypothetical protein
MAQALSGFSSSRIRFGFRPAAMPEGLALVRPVYWIAASLVAGVALYLGGIQAVVIAAAALIALWAFAEPRTALWLATLFMTCLFVFFQREAPLGEEVPEEFFYWGTGIALITAGLSIATLFSRQVDWAITRRRLTTPPSLAMLALLFVILSATVYGLFVGNQVFAVIRQLFGCLLLPVYFFLALALFRTPGDVDRWLAHVSWVVALGSAWYVVKLGHVSFMRGGYYREQSPLSSYAGAVALMACAMLIARRRIGVRLQALAQLALCVFAIVLMGSRSAVGSVLAAGIAITLLAMGRRRVILVVLLVSLLPLAAGLAPYLMTRLLDSRGLAGDVAGRFIFTLSEDQSYQGRVVQTQVVLDMVNKQPVLGAGMGSENSFVMPGEGRVKVASVDNGWGYLLLKMGYVGLAVFLALVLALLKTGLSGLAGVRSAMLRADSLAVVGAFLYALVSFLSGPIFFHFSVAPFFATVLGALVALGGMREQAAAGKVAS